MTGRSPAFSDPPAPPRAESPATQLVARLRAARDAGHTFDRAWREALPTITWNAYRTTAAQERRAITWARPYFRDAYLHPQTRPKWATDLLTHIAEFELAA